MKKLIALLGLVVLLVATSTSAQPIPPPALPPPVHINVQNRAQQTNVWCWAAVSQQIIEWGNGASPPQCALVAVANNASPAMCCGNPHPACVRTGTMPQVQYLIKTYGGHSSHLISPSLDPLGIYVHLSNGQPLIFEVRTTPAATHVVVVVGISFMHTQQGTVATLDVNDPMSSYTQQVPYSRIAPWVVRTLVID